MAEPQTPAQRQSARIFVFSRAPRKSVRSPKSSSARLKPSPSRGRGASLGRVILRANFHEFWRDIDLETVTARRLAAPSGAGSLIFLDTMLFRKP